MKKKQHLNENEQEEKIVPFPKLTKEERSSILFSIRMFILNQKSKKGRRDLVKKVGY